jgi:hypothetical protein
MICHLSKRENKISRKIEFEKYFGKKRQSGCLRKVCARFSHYVKKKPDMSCVQSKEEGQRKRKAILSKIGI